VTVEPTPPPTVDPLTFTTLNLFEYPIITGTNLSQCTFKFIEADGTVVHGGWSTEISLTEYKFGVGNRVKEGKVRLIITVRGQEFNMGELTILPRKTNINGLAQWANAYIIVHYQYLVEGGADANTFFFVKDGVEYPADIKVISNGGLHLWYPHHLEEGDYSVRVKNRAGISDSKDKTRIINYVTDKPYIMRTNKTNYIPGDELIITGVNFTGVTSILFESPNSRKRVEISPLTSDTECRVRVPAEVQRGANCDISFSIMSSPGIVHMSNEYSIYIESL